MNVVLKPVVSISLWINDITLSSSERRWRPFYLAAVLIIIAFSVLHAIGRLNANSGDASIYWVYAKSMWEHGPLYYGGNGPKHGATSTLWVLLLSVIYPICNDQFMCYKLLNVALLVLASFSTFRLAVYVTESVPGALAAGALLLLSSPLQEFTAYGFETPLFILILVEYIVN